MPDTGYPALPDPDIRQAGYPANLDIRPDISGMPDIRHNPSNKASKVRERESGKGTEIESVDECEKVSMSE